MINAFGDLIVRPFPLELSLHLNLSGALTMNALTLKSMRRG